MKTIRTKWVRLCTLIGTALLGAFGFSSCETHEPMYGAPMYAPPEKTFSFKVKGLVTDEAENPLPGIEVTVNDYDYTLDTTHTDADGKFMMDEINMGGGMPLNVVLTDVDGEDNGGSFASDTLDVFEMIPLGEIKVDTIREGDGLWDGGEYELSFERKMKKEATGDGQEDR